MEIPADVLIHNEHLGMKGARGRLLTIAAAWLKRVMNVEVGVMKNSTIMMKKLIRKPYHMTHWIWTNHRKLLIRTSAAIVEKTHEVIVIPHGVANQSPAEMSVGLSIVTPSPVTSGYMPRIEVSHPARACH